MTATILDFKRNPYDNSGGPFILDISEDIDFIAPETDSPLLSVLGWGSSALEIASARMGSNSLRQPCTSFKHSWLNDELVQSQGTVTANYTSGGGAITVGASQVLAFRVDDVIRVKSSAVAASLADLFYLVTTVGATTLTVTAINSDADITSGDPWYYMGNAKKVGAAANTTGKSTVLVQTDNFTQIFSDDVVVTGTELSVEQYGIKDPLGREIKKTAARLITGLERDAHYGYRSSVVPAASTTAGRMGGLFYYLRVASGGQNVSAAGVPLSESFLDTQLDTIWSAGGMPDTILVGATGLRQIKNFNRPFTTTPRGERTAGLVVDRYEAANGLALDVILDRHLSPGDAVILTKDLVGIGPLAGNGNSRAFVAAEIPQNGGDFRMVNIRGEYTMEIRNRQTHHMWIYGLATTVS